MCDNVKDCSDGSDETDCIPQHICDLSNILCKLSSINIITINKTIHY